MTAVSLHPPIATLGPQMGRLSIVGPRRRAHVETERDDDLIGEVDLFFHARYDLTAAERSLLEALTAHLASAIENLRLNALELEAAVSQERTFLARELHDSIAQSLAFMKIQVQLMRDAMASGEAARMQQVIGEIDVGVRECYGDVRELLVHFRTRTNTDDIEAALQLALTKNSPAPLLAWLENSLASVLLIQNTDLKKLTQRSFLLSMLPIDGSRVSKLVNGLQSREISNGFTSPIKGEVRRLLT